MKQRLLFDGIFVDRDRLTVGKRDESSPLIFSHLANAAAVYLNDAGVRAEVAAHGIVLKLLIVASLVRLLGC